MSNYNNINFYWIYVLRLKEGKYYIGISKDVQRRFDEHRAGLGAEFTSRYKPIEIIYMENTQRVNKKQAEKIENIMTIKWMMLKGIDNVRGGDYCSIKTCNIELSKKAKEYINWGFFANQMGIMDENRLKIIAENIYKETSQYAIKETEITEQIEERNLRNGRSYCSVDMCVYNERRRCRKGVSPYDVERCEANYTVRI